VSAIRGSIKLALLRSCV